jgi:Icc-related predicted phosphoesterase
VKPSEAAKLTRRIAWLTDIHLEFLKPPQIDTFLQEVAAHNPDAVVITGDIAQATILRQILQYMAQTLVKPVYFVLGNHDFYGSDVEPVREQMAKLTREMTGAAWMPAAGLVELSPDTVMVGHDGWADGRYGDYLRSPIVLNDYVHIESLKIVDSEARLKRLNTLGDQAGDYLRGILPEACKTYQNVFVLTHAPPFQEACWYMGKTPDWDNPYLPHFTCKAVGDALLHTAQTHPEVKFTVLCGHVHHGGVAQIRDNLLVITGGAEYEHPEVQRVFEFDLT